MILLDLRDDNRNYGLDYLRIVACFLVILGHMQSQTILHTMPFSFEFGYFFKTIFGNFQRISINIFILISAWFLCDKVFVPKRFLNIWIKVFIINSVVTS